MGGKGKPKDVLDTLFPYTKQEAEGQEESPADQDAGNEQSEDNKGAGSPGFEVGPPAWNVEQRTFGAEWEPPKEDDAEKSLTFGGATDTYEMGIAADMNKACAAVMKELQDARCGTRPSIFDIRTRADTSLFYIP